MACTTEVMKLENVLRIRRHTSINHSETKEATVASWIIIRSYTYIYEKLLEQKRGGG